MKKVIGIICLLLVGKLSAEEFKPGVHFQEVAQRSNGKNEVVEFFSFGCPHCFSFFPAWKEIKGKMKGKAKLRESHVLGLGYASNEMQIALSKAFVIAKLLKVEDKVLPDIFHRIHVDKKGFASENEIKDVFVENGIDKARYEKMESGFTVANLLRKMEKDYKSYNVANHGVPAVIVNGRYKVLGGVNSAEEYARLLDYLLAKN